MLQSYPILPKKLRTEHYPGKRIVIWINDKKISSLQEVSPLERSFLHDFVLNLEKLGWNVLIQDNG